MSLIANVSAVLAQLDDVNVRNDDRLTKARVWSFFLYFFTAVGLVFYTLILATLQSYTICDCCAPCCHESGPKKRLAVWFTCLVITQFILTGAAGLPGFMVINFVFLIWMIILGIVGCIVRRQSAEESRQPKGEDAKWAQLPRPYGTTQTVIIAVSSIMTVVCLILCIIIAYAWKSDNYLLVDGDDNVEIEFRPELTDKALMVMYSWPGLATDMRLQVYVRLLTDYCGTAYNKTLSNKNTIKVDWIDKYGINMSLYDPSDYTQYNTVNDWFIRAIRPEYRPIASPSNDSIIVSPADARMVAYANRQDAIVWVKRSQINYASLIDNVVVANQADYFNDGIMLIARLAPQDYHRFHAPVSGKIVTIVSKTGTIWSVSSDAVLSKNKVLYNQRKIMIIDAGQLGYVGYVAVGATCVGSVTLNRRGVNNTLIPLQVGDTITKGEEIGLMQFGGSTVVLLFRNGAITVNDKIIRNSRYPVETHVLMGEQIAEMA